MPKAKDYYRILGVAESATTDEIKKAYRKLARTYHPDRNPDKPAAEERFKEIQEAHSVLGNEDRRKEYDRARKNPFAGHEGSFRRGNGGFNRRDPDSPYVHFEGGNPFGGFGPAGEEPNVFGDFFGRIFGGEGPPQPGQSRVMDVEAEVHLSFREALEGGRTAVSLPDGGQVRLAIPKGVRDGFKIKIRERGRSAGGRRGDLYVTFRVEQHPRFRREADDLYTTVEIDAFQAMTGASLDIENAYGRKVRVNVSAGTQPGDRMRLRGQGVESAKGTGDLYVELAVSIPRNLSPEQREQLEQIGKEIRGRS
jgi:curved DNA-binding protein